MIYFALILFLVLLVYAYDIGNIREERTTFFYTLLIMLVLVPGLSYRVGIDVIRYMDDYTHYPKLFELNRHYFDTSIEDPLWIIFESSFRTITDDFMWLHLTHSLIVNTIILLFIKRHSPHVFTTILLYVIIFYVFFNFETLRESLAVVVYLLAFDAMAKKQWLKYYAIAFATFFLHSSALFVFVIPLLLLLVKGNAVKSLMVILCTFLLLGRLINEYVLELAQTLPINERILYKMGVYLGREVETISTGVLIKNTIVPTLLLLSNKFIFKRTSPFEPFARIFLLIGITSIFIPVMDRFLNYVFVFYIIYVSTVFFGLLDKLQSRNFKFIGLAASFVVFSFAPLSWYFTVDDRISEQNYHRYFPYSSQFTKKTVATRERFFRNGS